MEVIANCEIVVIGERILGGKSNMAFHVQIQRKTMKSQSPSEKTIWYRIFVSIYDLCIYQQSLTHSSFRTWNWSCMWAFPLFLIILFFSLSPFNFSHRTWRRVSLTEEECDIWSRYVKLIIQRLPFSNSYKLINWL